MAKKGKRGLDGLFGGIKEAFDSFDESFEVFEQSVEEELVDAGIQSTNQRGVSKQTVHGEGYEIRVTRTKKGPAVIVVASSPDVMVIVNGKEIEAE